VNRIRLFLALLVGGALCPRCGRAHVGRPLLGFQCKGCRRTFLGIRWISHGAVARRLVGPQ
jgi:ribosomal protein L37AE/L43A